MVDEKRLIEEIEKIFETDEENIDCTLSDFAYHVFDCIKEQPKVGEWIPADEPPKDDNYILLSFENYSCHLIGRYESDGEMGGAYYIGDCDGEDTCVANNLFVNAWKPLPEPYKGE